MVLRGRVRPTFPFFQFLVLHAAEWSSRTDGSTFSAQSRTPFADAAGHMPRSMVRLAHHLRKSDFVDRRQAWQPIRPSRMMLNAHLNCMCFLPFYWSTPLSIQVFYLTNYVVIILSCFSHHSFMSYFFIICPISTINCVDFGSKSAGPGGCSE